MLPKPKRIVHVLLPTGVRSEADAARRALGSDDVKLIMGTASAHTAGQRLEGDVVVIGKPPATIHEDATGEVKVVASLAALSRSAKPEKEATQPALAAPTPPPTPESESSPETSEAIDLEYMGRDQLLEIAAEKGVELPSGYVSKAALIAAIRAA